MGGVTNEGFSTALLNAKLSLLEEKLRKANEEINELNDECKVLAKRVIERNATIREKDARIKELEADVKREAQSSTHNAQDCLDEQLRAEALEAELASAKNQIKTFVKLVEFQRGVIKDQETQIVKQSTLETDNAAQAARIKELENQLRILEQDWME